MSNEYRESDNRIILTGETAKRFNNLAKHPNIDTMHKRDAFLKEIHETIEVEKKGKRTIIRTKSLCF